MSRGHWPRECCNALVQLDVSGGMDERGGRGESECCCGSNCGKGLIL